MKNNDYADFSDQIADYAETNQTLLVLGVNRNNKVVFGKPKHWDTANWDRKYLYQIKGGAGTGSTHAIKAMVTAMCEHTQNSICIVSNTDYSKLSNGVDIVYVKPSKKKVQKLMEDYTDNKFDVVIVDNMDSLAGPEYKELVEGCMGGKAYANIVVVDKNIPDPDVTYVDGKGETRNETFDIMWVPLGETLPNYFDLAAIRRYQKMVRDAKMTDYLKNDFDFDDYKHELLAAHRHSRKLNLKVGVGVDYQGNVVKVDLEHMRHLLIGASSGAGKSHLLRSIMLQLLHNNHPDDLKLMLIEPQKGLAFFAEYPHVKCFVGNDTPEYQEMPEYLDEKTGDMKVEPLVVGVHEIYTYLYEEMIRREELYRKYEYEWNIRIENLEEARSAAAAHMVEHQLDTHELFLPAIVVVAEEITQYMREMKAVGSVTETEVEMINEIRALASKLAQRSRAAGIGAINLAQDLKNTYVPIELKNNSNIIGMTCNTPRASINIWGDSSMHNLGKPGRGILNELDTGDLTDFRGFFTPMGEINYPEGPGSRERLRDLFAENLSHLALRDERLNGWEK